MSSDPNCIFCKIIAGQIPSRKVYEDEELFGFHDIAPWAPVHFMLVPKRHIPSMAQVTPDDAALLGRIMTLAPSWPWSRAAGPTRRAASASSSTPAPRAGRKSSISMCTSWAAPAPGSRVDIPRCAQGLSSAPTKIEHFFRSNPWVHFPSGTG